MTRTLPILMLSEQDVRGLGISLKEFVDLTEQAYRIDAEGHADVPTKIGVHPDYRKSFLHAMPAWVGGSARALGMKWVSYFPGNFDRGMPDSTGIIILNHPDHGHPVCIMEGMYVTFARTAACAAVAVKYLLREPPRSLGLVGCGGLGRSTLQTMTALFPSIETIRVSSRTEASRRAFCDELGREGRYDLRPVAETCDAVRRMDVVVSSTPPVPERPVRGEWLSPGSIYIPLDVVNAWDDVMLRQASRIVADNPAHFLSQVRNQRPTAFRDDDRADSLQAIIGGLEPAASTDGRTFVAICGIASIDVVIGWEAYRRAVAASAGRMFEMC